MEPLVYSVRGSFGLFVNSGISDVKQILSLSL